MPPRDESSERTEMPTPLRLEEARRRGQVARSGDLTSALILLGGLGGLAALAPRMLAAMKEMMAAALRQAAQPVCSPVSAAELLSGPIGPVLVAVAVLIGIVTVAAAVAGVIQVGPLFTGEPLSMDFSRVLPRQGWRRMFSTRGAVRGGLGLCKVIVAAVLGFVTVRSALPVILYAGRLSAAEVGSCCGRLVVQAAARVGVALLFLAILDYLYQRWQHKQDLKMTRREYLDDLRRMEGDPLIRRRQRKQRRTHRTRSLPKRQEDSL